MPGLITPVPLRNQAIALRNQFDELTGAALAGDRLMDLVTFIDVDTPVNLFAWLAAFPQFREWIGQRMVHGLGERTHQITIKQYELTIGLDRIQFDQSKSITRQTVLAGMADEAAYLPRRLVIDTLRNGQNLAAYDGQGWLDTDHPVSPDNAALGTQSNYEAAGFALTRANFRLARTRLRGFKGENGRNFGIGTRGRLLLVIPPELEAAATDIVSMDYVAVAGGMQRNVDYQAADILVVPELSVDPTTWYLADPTGTLRPIAVQRYGRTRVVEKNSETDDNLFWHKEYIFGADLFLGVGPAAWMKIFKGVG